MNNIEVEVKILLQSREKKEAFLKACSKKYPLEEKATNSQLNHYFAGGDLWALEENISLYLSEEQKNELKMLISKAKSFSARTRKANDDVIFVLKASVDETNSINGTWRLEFEVHVPLSIDELDGIFLKSWFEYETKWSRDRVEYNFWDYTLCIDENSGYWFLAEIERVVPDGEDIDTIKSDIRSLIEELWSEELSQDRVNRMYNHYIHVWPHYYGTKNWFNVE